MRATTSGVEGCVPLHQDCLRASAESIATRAWRRPLDENDKDALRAVAFAGNATGDVRETMSLLIEAILTAPEFLYEAQVGTSIGQGWHRLTAHERASRLALFLTDDLPDSLLLDAADTGALDDDTVLVEHARRLLFSAKSDAALTRFHREWLDLSSLAHLDKDAVRYPFFDAQVRSAMADEFNSFVTFNIKRSDGQLSTLLTAPYSFVRAPLHRIYGLDSPVAMSDTTPVGLPSATRAGVLTLPAVMATHAHGATTSPIHRGLFIYKNLLCGQLRSPSEELDINSIVSDPFEVKSRRELLAEHRNDPVCWACHRYTDPLGIVFENYDAVGAWRDVDIDVADSIVIDASVEVTTDTDIDGTYDGPVSLIHALARSERVASCYVRQWYRFMTGRSDTRRDQALLDTLIDGFKESGGDIQSLVLSLVASPAFSYRFGDLK